MRLVFRASLLLGSFSFACGGNVVVDGAPAGGEGGGGFGGGTSTVVTTGFASSSAQQAVSVVSASAVTTGMGGYGAAPGSGGNGAAPGSGGNGAAPGTTSYAYASSGSGGGCARCYEAITGSADPAELCPESYELYANIVTCICDKDCAAPCKEACYGSGELGPGCENCVYGQCGEELEACFNDF